MSSILAQAETNSHSAPSPALATRGSRRPSSGMATTTTTTTGGGGGGGGGVSTVTEESSAGGEDSVQSEAEAEAAALEAATEELEKRVEDGEEAIAEVHALLNESTRVQRTYHIYLQSYSSGMVVSFNAAVFRVAIDRLRPSCCCPCSFVPVWVGGDWRCAQAGRAARMAGVAALEAAKQRLYDAESLYGTLQTCG